MYLLKKSQKDGLISNLVRLNPSQSAIITPPIEYVKQNELYFYKQKKTQILVT